MPQRFLKPGIRSSRKWESCSWQGQSFYVRLVTLVDDYGRYEVDDVRLKNEAFPLREDIRASQVREFLLELEGHQLAVFYKADGKSYLALVNWTERPRYDSKYPQPPKGSGCMMNDGELSLPKGKSCLTDNFSCHPSSVSLPKPNVLDNTPSNARARESVEWSNAPEIEVALAYVVELNRRMEAPDYEPKGSRPFTAAEVRQAYQSLEATRDESGQWWWGKRPVGDWRAALESRMLSQRNGKDHPAEKGKVGANEIKQTLRAKRL